MQICLSFNCYGQVISLVLNVLVLCFTFKHWSSKDSYIVLVNTNNILELG